MQFGPTLEAVVRIHKSKHNDLSDDTIVAELPASRKVVGAWSCKPSFFKRTQLWWSNIAVQVASALRTAWVRVSWG